MNIGERIRSLRKERDLTQKELSKLSSISEISIRKYENGDRQPKQNAIFHLAKALNVNEGWLMGYDVPMEREENIILAEQSEELTSFIRYLESIKYLVRIEKDMRDDESLTDGDNETFVVSLSKDKKTISFTEEEFDEFQDIIKKSIEFEIFKADESKK
ncbi:helix-turn-helix transcriptional regulator [Alkalicella caledoniensis]|uniref:Helix-turn-helix transcriptional regulator n=1 Tax=Alkalicella caledoniensis TaxID=2731377 RepID=A0A7G9W9F2_ALKCA|nr:helix-turn-helix transcriptional regulator [Alkalicella caledoniensis]QNO15314.1 helix-turn-helix transcriptional regulator [Alkalicella caledoniensis]